MSTAARLHRMGLGLLTAQAGLAALGAVLAGSANGSRAGPAGAVVAAMPVRWDRFLAHAGSQSQLFAEYHVPQPAGSSASAPAGAQPTASIAAQLGIGGCLTTLKLRVRLRQFPEQTVCAFRRCSNQCADRGCRYSRAGGGSGLCCARLGRVTHCIAHGGEPAASCFLGCVKAVSFARTAALGSLAAASGHLTVASCNANRSAPQALQVKTPKL